MPILNKQEYENMTLAELKEVAKGLEIKNLSKYKKSELIEEILLLKANSIEKNGVILKEKIAPKNEVQNAAKKEELKSIPKEQEYVKGILEILENNSFGFLRCKNYLTSSEDVYVSPSQIRRFNLKNIIF